MMAHVFTMIQLMLFYYDCNNTLIIDNTDYESFEIMMQDFDEGILSL